MGFRLGAQKAKREEMGRKATQELGMVGRQFGTRRRTRSSMGQVVEERTRNEDG